MADMLIEGVPEEVVAVVDARAARLGMSRGLYLRRLLAGDAVGSAVGPTDLDWFAGTFAGLADSEVMARAWQ